MYSTIKAMVGAVGSKQTKMPGTCCKDAIKYWEKVQQKEDSSSRCLLWKARILKKNKTRANFFICTSRWQMMTKGRNRKIQATPWDNSFSTILSDKPSRSFQSVVQGRHLTVNKIDTFYQCAWKILYIWIYSILFQMNQRSKYTLAQLSLDILRRRRKYTPAPPQYLKQLSPDQALPSQALNLHP